MVGSVVSVTVGRPSLVAVRGVRQSVEVRSLESCHVMSVGQVSRGEDDGLGEGSVVGGGVAVGSGGVTVGSGGVTVGTGGVTVGTVSTAVAVVVTSVSVTVSLGLSDGGEVRSLGGGYLVSVGDVAVRQDHGDGLGLGSVVGVASMSSRSVS